MNALWPSSMRPLHAKSDPQPRAETRQLDEKPTFGAAEVRFPPFADSLNDRFVSAVRRHPIPTGLTLHGQIDG